MTLPVMHRHREQGADDWLPTDITGLQLWIDFSDPTTLFTDAGTTPVSADADLIYQANDKSGNNKHLVQATSGSRPAYKVNIQNSKSAGFFASGSPNDFMEVAPPTLSQPFTFFVVVKIGTGSGQQRIFDSTNRVLFDCNFGSAAGSQYNYYANSGSGADNTWGTGDTNAHIHTILFNGASPTIRLDAAAQTVSYNTSTTQLATSLRIGVDPAAANPLKGYMLEILLYSGAVSAGNIALIETYLNTKWAVY